MAHSGLRDLESISRLFVPRGSGGYVVAAGATQNYYYYTTALYAVVTDQEF